MEHAVSTRLKRVAAIAGATVIASAGLVASQQHEANAASNYNSTITTVLPVKAAATTAKVVITINGTNFAEEQIANIDLSTADTACQGLTSYVVVSATQIAVKTPSAGCAASGSTAENVVIHEVGGGDVTKTAAVSFITPPDLVLTAAKPVVTENSSSLSTANQVTALQPAGNQLIRVKASSSYSFDQRSSAQLTGTLGGRALSNITVYNSTGTAQGTTNASDNGNWFTARTPSGLVAGQTYPLVLSQAGVSKTFTATYTGLTWVGGPTVTSLDVTSGKAGGGTTVKITGTGFPTSVSDAQDTSKWTVKFCGETATVTATTATVLTVTTPNPSTATGLGTTTYAGACPVVVTDVTNSLSSVLSGGSYYVYLTS